MSQASTVPSSPSSGDAPRLAHVVDVDAHEGPVYAADEHALYFTSLPRPGRAAPVVDIKRLDLASREVSVLVADARMANGMALGHDGALLVCEQGTLTLPAAIARVDRATGERRTVVAAPLNSPNDIVVKSDGTIWFTDPSYGWLQGFRPEPLGGDAVYRYDPAHRRPCGRRRQLRQAERPLLLARRDDPLRRRQRRAPPRQGI